ncbi:MAG TPA: TonB-dependent receptor [Candidatus Acidoferrales bacterium]|nr:TonB-dependent receptor [Candidatus Acidoferrales bacterium]
MVGKRIERAIGFVATVILFLLAIAAMASAQESDTGEIDITVTDGTTKAPLGNARVILVGPVTVSSLTTKAGIIKYTDVPVGIYRVRVLHPGFAPGSSPEFEVLSDRDSAVSVALGVSSSSHLRVIGTAVARTNISVTSTEITDSSAIRRLSDSMTDALDKLAGVTVTQSSTDPDSAITISLNGHDESQTSITLDGIPLSAPGAAANLRQIDTDLFSGSSVSFSPTASGLGGSVNFRTLQPTQTWEFQGGGSTGTFDKNTYQLALTGSLGKLGIAAEHVFRDGNNPLTFQTYADESGLPPYEHGGFSHSSGDYIKFRYSLGDQVTLSGTALDSNRYNSQLCTQDVTLLPCGIGPGNESYGHVGFGYLTLQSLIGEVTTEVTAFTNSNTQTSDDLNRYIDIQPAPPPGSLVEPTPGPTLAPSLTNSDSYARGFAFTSSVAERQHTFTLSGNTYDSVMNSLPFGSPFETAFTNAIASSAYQFADTIKSNDKVSLSPHLSLADTTGAGGSVLYGMGASWQPTAVDAYTGSIDVGSSQPGNNVNKSFSDPTAAQINCEAGTAIVSGPGDEPSHQSSLSFNAGWTHQVRHAQSTISVSSQVQQGQLIQALLAEPATYFEAGYLSAVQSAYDGPNGCGSKAGAPTVYVNTPIGGTKRLYQGLNYTGRYQLGNNVVAIPTYTINVAKLVAADEGILGLASSPTMVGAQLPGRPLHRGGLTLDALHTPSGTEFLANAQYTGPDNSQHLGAYITAAAGISHNFGPGRMTLFETNIFGTYTALFSSDAYAQPEPLSGGGSLLVAAQPLAPRTLTLSYNVVLGGPPPPASFGRMQVAQATPAPRRGGFRLQLVAPPPGVDPLSLATSRESCTADQQQAAKPLLDALRAYVTAYEAKAPLPTVDALDVIPHPLTGQPIAYYLELRPKLPAGAGAAGAANGETRRSFGGGGFGGGGRGFGGGGGGEGPGGPGGPPPEGGPPPDEAPPPGVSGGNGGNTANPRARGAFRAFGGLLACAYATMLSRDDARAKGIVLPTNGRPGFYYVPSIGLVVVRPAELPVGGGSVKGS